MGNVVVEERTIILNVLPHIICNVCLCSAQSHAVVSASFTSLERELWHHTHINHHWCWWHCCGSRGVKSVDFHPMSVVLLLSCELLGGCLGSEGRSDLSSARRRAVCFNSGTDHFHPQLWEVELLHRVTQGNKACLTGGPVGEAGGQWEANVLHQDHSIVVCFSHVLLCGGGLDLTPTISLAFHITSHWAVLVSVGQLAVLLLNTQSNSFTSPPFTVSLWYSQSNFPKNPKG